MNWSKLSAAIALSYIPLVILGFAPFGFRVVTYMLKEAN